MKIAIIAWGSLVWDPRTLQIKDQWNDHGPNLNIEFSRVSKDGRLTLVIDLVNGSKIKTHYAESSRKDLGDAISDLRDREGTIRKRIGFVDVKNNNNSKNEFQDQTDVFSEMEKWCNTNQYDAAVWTALPSQFSDQTKMEFSVENAMKYLGGLPKSARNNALNYINKAPKSVVTPVRSKVEESDVK